MTASTTSRYCDLYEQLADTWPEAAIAHTLVVNGLALKGQEPSTEQKIQALEDLLARRAAA